ncbi:hypothetical protein BJ741DRAFT_127326 [Chytriomyces cf. hyalinus JEL632]|nr:hypothetical protein BJ741DRAFT_127326 [Chytriomyces cf. hyalinus JEL632]
MLIRLLCTLSNNTHFSVINIEIDSTATAAKLTNAIHAAKLARVDPDRLTLVRIFKEEKGKVVGRLTTDELMNSAECLRLASYGGGPQDVVEPQPSHYYSLGVCKTMNGRFFKVINLFKKAAVYLESTPDKLLHVLVLVPRTEAGNKITWEAKGLERTVLEGNGVSEELPEFWQSLSLPPVAPANGILNFKQPDLTIWKDFRQQLFVRKCYDDVYTLILKQVNDRLSKGFTIKGNSGIGKSKFLFYMLLRLKQDSIQTVVPERDRSIYVFSQNRCFETMDFETVKSRYLDNK